MVTLNKPTIGSTGWGDDVNDNFDTIETELNKMPTVGAHSFSATGQQNGKVEAVSFGTTFSSAPKVICTGHFVSGDDDNVQFVVSTRSVTTTGFDAVCYISYIGASDANNYEIRWAAFP